jgi:hypothetical protein
MMEPRKKKVVVEIPLEEIATSNNVRIGDFYIAICQDPNKTACKAWLRLDNGREDWFREPNEIVAIMKDDTGTKRARGRGVLTGMLKGRQGVQFSRLHALKWQTRQSTYKRRYWHIPVEKWPEIRDSLLGAFPT